MTTSRIRLIQAAVALALSAASLAGAPAFAQQYPARPITLIMPFGVGGGPDQLSRNFAAALEPIVGQKVVVENRVGAGGFTAGEYVARSTPDGYTLLFNSMAGMHAGLFVKGLPIDLPTVLTPIGQVADAPQFIMVPASVARNLKDFIAYVKANPGKLNAAVIGNTTTHLDTLRFLKVAGLEMTTIPYNGSPDAVAALLRGDVQLFWVGLSILKSHIEAGRVAAVAVATRERTALAPEVPTVREQGLDYEGGLSSYVVFGPPGMRRDLVEFLHKKIAETLGNAVLRERVKPIGYALLTATAAPEEISVLLSREVRAMKDSAASVGLKPQ